MTTDESGSSSSSLGSKVAKVLGDRILLETSERNEILEEENKILLEENIKMKHFLQNDRFFCLVEFVKINTTSSTSALTEDTNVVVYKNYFVREVLVSSEEIWWDDIPNHIPLKDILDCALIVDGIRLHEGTIGSFSGVRYIDNNNCVQLNADDESVFIKLTLSEPVTEGFLTGFIEDNQNFDLNNLTGLFVKDIRCLILDAYRFVWRRS